MKIGYLGPRGTFSEQAAIIASQAVFTTNSENELKPFHTIREVIEATQKGEVDEGIVPIENSTEGAINITVDTLTFDVNLYIKRMIELPVEQNLIIKKDTKPEEIKKIYSHPQAIAQCREYILKNFPNADTYEVSSTAEAVRLVSESDDKDCAAIGLINAAELYGLAVYEKSIQDRNINFTTFSILTKKKTPLCSDNKKTAVAFSVPNEPGQLIKIMQIFSMWELNMTMILSRPMRNKPKEYVFHVDIENAASDKDLADAMEMVKRKTTFFKILGCFDVLDLRK